MNVKMPNFLLKNPSGTHPFRPQYSSPYPKYQYSASCVFSPSPEVFKKACHIPVGQKLREEIDFEETCHFLPRAVPWSMADLRPTPKNYLS